MGIRSFAVGVVALATATAATAAPINITVTIENLSPVNGTWITPVWAAFHDGSWDTFDMGSPASMELESLAEDGATAMLAGLFNSALPNGVEGTLVSDDAPPPPLQPGDLATGMFTIDSMYNQYFSYASMVIPSNDAFIGNDDPKAIKLFDDYGNFVGADFFIAGDEVLDAGTEVNDELPANTAAFGQAAPNTGVDENGVIRMHPGYNPIGSGGILDDPSFVGADFTLEDYPIARIVITPEPTMLALLLPAFIGLIRRR